jgi:hypothetical protein
VNDKDKDAFENWFRDYWSFDDLNKTDCFNSWRAACEYKELEINAHVNHLVDWDDEIGRLKKEIDELKEKLEASDAVIDCFYEATKKVGW